ncbi:hypothetical protein ANN_19116, partial [Periplaneta americana]
LLHVKRKEYANRTEQKLIKDAECKPYRILDVRRSTVASHIPMETWEAYYSELLQRTRLAQQDTRRNHTETEAYSHITEAEVWSVVKRSKLRKAAGPDNITNELMKESLPYTVRIWTAIYNKCMELRTIPISWRRSQIKVLYKGK